MKALFLTPLTEEKKQQFLNTDIQWTFKNKKDVTKDDFIDIDIVFGNPKPELLENTNVKWLQLDSAGANTYCNLPDTIQLTNASGAYGQGIAEHMLAYTLAVKKNVFAYETVAKNHNWTNLGSVPTINHLTVVSVGMGDIGSHYAKIMHTLGATVYGVRRTIHDTPSYIQKMYTFQDFSEILAQADIVALSLPETQETIHLFDYEMLHKIKKGAMIINVGRGSAIVSQDLIKVMQEKHLSAACLDVTEQEPLPRNSALWTCENVYITPHISGRFNAETTYDNVIDIMYTNLQHYLNNEPLEHVVNKQLGY